MSFLDDLSQKVTKAAQVAAEKSGEIVETTKLNANISSEESKVKALFAEMGKMCYEQYEKGEVLSAQFITLCDEVKKHKAIIAGYKQKLSDAKSVQYCPNCGKENPKENAFCSGCGQKLL